MQLKRSLADRVERELDGIVRIADRSERAFEITLTVMIDLPGIFRAEVVPEERTEPE